MAMESIEFEGVQYNIRTKCLTCPSKKIHAKGKCIKCYAKERRILNKDIGKCGICRRDNVDLQGFGACNTCRVENYIDMQIKKECPRCHKQVKPVLKSGICHSCYDSDRYAEKLKRESLARKYIDNKPVRRGMECAVSKCDKLVMKGSICNECRERLRQRDC